MAGKILGAQPPAPGPRQEVIRVTSVEPRLFIVCSRHPWGQWVHWYASRSSECVSDKKDCNGCLKGWPRKWKGYLHVTERSEGNGNFLEITPTFIAILRMQLPGEGDMRGVMMRVSKTKGGAKGRYIVDVLDRRHEAKNLPEERDPYPLLQYLWQAKTASSHDNA